MTKENKQPRRRRRNHLPKHKALWKRVPFPVYLLVVMVFGVALAVTIPKLWSNSDQDTPMTGAAAPLRATLGTKAPGFTLRDEDGKSYTLTPGDGRRHLLVFYMGYF